MVYYHVALTKKGTDTPKDVVFLFNLNLDDIGQEVVIPIAKQQQINCKGNIVQYQEIEFYRISETEEPANEVLAKEKKKQGYLSKAEAIIAKTTPALHHEEWMIMNAGKNVTNLMTKKFVQRISEVDNSILLNSYKEGINKVIDKMVTEAYETLASFGHSSKIETLTKVAKLNWYNDILENILPETFKRTSELSDMNRHIRFMLTFLEKNDFEWFKNNADDLIKKDIPSVKKKIDDYFNQIARPNEAKAETKNYEKEANLEIISKEPLESLFKEIKDNLRATMHKAPANEIEIQDRFEDILKIKGYAFEREQVSIPYSTKTYYPDFTIESLSVAVDLKFCNSPTDERKIIDEINADIPAYKTRYDNLLFVLYDMSVIRKLKEYASGIEENNPRVKVIIIKH
jgi:hypothetical protein